MGGAPVKIEVLTMSCRVAVPRKHVLGHHGGPGSNPSPTTWLASDPVPTSSFRVETFPCFRAFALSL